MESYRHKKFDLHRRRRDSIDLQIKEELISVNLKDEEDSHYNNNNNSSSSSQCSSDYSASIQSVPKRRRLNSSTYDISNDSESASSSHSLPTAAISPEALRDICKYHGNMVRNFPKKERTPKDQERRNKNTIACRMSRRVKKLEHLAIEVEYKEFKSEHLKIAEQSRRAAAYFKHISSLVHLEQVKSPARDPELPRSPIPAPVKNFSIDYLINGIKSEQC